MAELEDAVALAASITGFRPDAIDPRRLERELKRSLGGGESIASLIESVRAGDGAATQRLLAGVLVGETQFFRTFEQLELLASHVTPALSTEEDEVRAWCAGCATGEEAFSLAAFLLEGGRRRVSVLGTDLLERHVAVARGGRYPLRALRAPAPRPGALFASGDELVVAPALRSTCRFHVHNLLDPPPAPPGGFHLITCRNVLVYFDRALAREVAASLASALAPGGVVAFAVLDVDEPPPGLVRLGPPDVQCWWRPAATASAADVAPPRAPAVPPSERVPVLPVTAPRPSTHVERHVRALRLVETGDPATALAILEQLTRDEPEYLPARLARALLLARRGALAEARAAMRDVIRRAATLAPGTVVDGPEELGVEFYLASAEAFLENGERTR